MKNSIFFILIFFLFFCCFFAKVGKKSYFNGETFFIVFLDAAHSSFVLITHSMHFFFYISRGVKVKKLNMKYINNTRFPLSRPGGTKKKKANALTTKRNKKKNHGSRGYYISADGRSPAAPFSSSMRWNLYKMNLSRAGGGFSGTDEDLEWHYHYFICFFASLCF